jgi:hypothetical protein
MSARVRTQKRQLNNVGRNNRNNVLFLGREVERFITSFEPVSLRGIDRRRKSFPRAGSSEIFSLRPMALGNYFEGISIRIDPF